MNVRAGIREVVKLWTFVAAVVVAVAAWVGLWAWIDSLFANPRSLYAAIIVAFGIASPLFFALSAMTFSRGAWRQ